MDREVKYRAYRETSKRWVYGVYAKGDGTLLPLNCYRMSKFWELVEEGVLKNVTQCAGQKDKNSKEIYEGDEINLWLDGVGMEKFVVKWDSHKARFTLIDKLGDTWSFDDSNDMEIIGNRFENPELLKQGVK